MISRTPRHGTVIRRGGAQRWGAPQSGTIGRPARRRPRAAGERTHVNAVLRKWTTWPRVVVPGLIVCVIAGLAAAGKHFGRRWFEQGCMFDGKLYHSGEGLPRVDCNWMWCNDGGIATTLKRCEDPVPSRTCHQRQDAAGTAGWRGRQHGREETPRRVVLGTEIVRVEQREFHWNVWIRLRGDERSPEDGVVWVLKEDCQSGWVPLR